MEAIFLCISANNTSVLDFQTLLFSLVGRLSEAKSCTLFGTLVFEIFCHRNLLPSGFLLDALWSDLFSLIASLYALFTVKMLSKPGYLLYHLRGL
jgi:hypothetical protein